MRVISESWCFCNGGGKSERLKASIFTTKSCSMVKFSTLSSSSSSTSGSSTGAGGGGGGGEGSGFGTGFLIHRNLLLTTHVNLPCVSVAENSEILLQNGLLATFVPHRFFITSSVLDLTIVGIDTIEGDSIFQGQQPQYLKLCSKPNLELGNVVYLLGHAEKKELMIGEGKVVIATDNLIKVSTEGFTWSLGSAGFDSQGNIAFMICDPMKLATSPNTKSSSTTSSSSTSWKKGLPMQFGIPMPIIFDWLNQHWEGSLDDLSKPKLPLMRLVSAGHKSDHSCASFTMRQVFKPTEEMERPTSSSNTESKSHDQPEQERGISDTHATTHTQGIPTPEIYESPKVTSNLLKNETLQIPLLDINFPSRVSKAVATLANSHPKGRLPGSDENFMTQTPSQSSPKDGKSIIVNTRDLYSKPICIGLVQSSHKDEKTAQAPSTRDQKQVKIREALVDVRNEETGSNGSVSDDAYSVQSSSSPVAPSELRDEPSEAETLYSAETAESRNYTSPREGGFQPIGRSQSCVSYSYNRWGPVHRKPVARRSPSEKQTSCMQPRKTYSQGTPSHKTMDYFSPTASSIMKKRNMLGQPTRPRPTAVHSSPRWNF